MKKNQYGISLVEVLISLAILGGTAIVVMNGSNIQLKSKEVKEVTEVSVEANRDAIDGFHKVLFDIVGDDQKLHTEGVCKLVRKDVYAAPPVGAININLSGLKDILTQERFKKYLPLWKFSQESKCSGDYVKCLELDESNKSITPELLKLHPTLKLTLIPVFMNPTAGKMFEAIKDGQYKNDIDVKSVGFTFKSSLSINIDNKPKIIKELETFEWTGQAGYCDVGGNILSFSGMEQVEGSNVIFNRQGFSTNKDAPFETSFRQTVAQSGKYESSGRYIFTDKSKSIATSCKETAYRCRQELSDQREYDSDLSVIADIGYITPNELTSGSSLPASISYDIKKGDSGTTLSKDKMNTFMSSIADCGISGPKTASAVQNCSQTNTLEKTMYGDNFISVAIWDNGTTSSSTKLCRQICDKNENYNFPNSDSQQAWGGFLNILIPGYDKTYKYKVSDRIGCTACYMKNCDQFGIGTFGAMHEMPYQPLDSQIPECAIHEPKKVLYNPMPYKGNSIPHNTGSKLCVFAKLNQTKDGFSYNIKNCDEKLPVMCFAYGKFLLARDIDSTSSVLSEVTYEDTAKRCFQMGHEIVDKSKLDSYITGSGRPSAIEKNYDFYNLAQQGLFIAPQIPEDITTFKVWAETLGLAGTEFWVALESESKNSFDVRIPLIPSFVDDMQDAVFFNGEKQLNYTQFVHKLPKSPTSGLGYGILFHNIKYKGVRFFNGVNPFGIIPPLPNGDIHPLANGLPFLCRRTDFPHEIFKSLGTSHNIADGPAKCSAEAGLFLPPVSSYEWVKALTVVDPVSKKHSFPEISAIENYKNFKMAWVAVQEDLTSAGINWEPFESSHLVKNFLKTDFFDPGISAQYKLNSLGEHVHNNLKTSEDVDKIESADAITGSFETIGPVKSDGKINIIYDFNTRYTINVTTGSTIEQIQDQINNESELKGKIEAKVSISTSGKKITIKSLNNKKIYLYESSVTKFLKLKTEEELVIRKLCFNNDQKLQIKSYKDSCGNYSLIDRRDMKSKSFKVLWSLNQLQNRKSMDHYVFE